MPREKQGDDIPGKFAGNDRKAVVQSENQRFRKQSMGGHLPTFRRNALFFNDMDNEDTTRYLRIYAQIINDPQYLADCVIEAITKYHKIGHFDEVVAAQQTAIDNYVQAYAKVFGNLIPMEMLHDYLTNPPTDEANDTTFGDGTQANTKIALYDRDTIATELLNLERSGVLRIPAIDSFLSKAFFVVEEHPEEKVGSTFSPGSNFMVGLPYNKLSDFQTDVGTLVTNIGKTKKFCNMFGVPLVPFKKEDFGKGKPIGYTVYQGWDHPNLDTWLAEMRFTIRDGGATQSIRGTYWTGSEYWRFIFKDKPDETYEQHVIDKLASIYHASYNIYGSTFTLLNGTTQDDLSFCCIYQDDASQGAANGFDPFAISEDFAIMDIMRFACSYEQTNTFNISATGTYITADNDLGSLPAYHYNKGYKKYGLFLNARLDDVVVEWMADQLRLTNVKKNSFSSVT